MQCPGQNRAYWKADAVFEVPCPQCGASVEFFKDESSGRCPSCGHRFLNPGADFGCAEWCSLAKECVGFVPDRACSPNLEGRALAARLIQAIKEQFSGDSARIARAVTVFRYATELVRSEGGDPRVILAAALLWEMTLPGPGGERPPEIDVSSKAEGILRGIGLDGPATGRVCEILTSGRTGGQLDTTEFRVVADASALASLAAEGLQHREEKLESFIQRGLRTASGRQKARSLFQA